VIQILGLDKETQNHLKLIESREFDIFKIREFTKDNELVAVISYLLAKEKVFDNLPVSNEKFLSFIRKV